MLTGSDAPSPLVRTRSPSLPLPSPGRSSASSVTGWAEPDWLAGVAGSLSSGGLTSLKSEAVSLCGFGTGWTRTMLPSSA